jgi:hypothetical protein
MLVSSVSWHDPDRISHRPNVERSSTGTGTDGAGSLALSWIRAPGRRVTRPRGRGASEPQSSGLGQNESARRIHLYEAHVSQHVRPDGRDFLAHAGCDAAKRFKLTGTKERIGLDCHHILRKEYFS